MSEHLLDGFDVRAGRHREAGCGVAKVVRRGARNRIKGVDDDRQENHCRKSGFRVWVIADFIAMSDEWQQVVDDIRNRLVDNADASSSVGRGARSRERRICSISRQCYRESEVLPRQLRRGYPIAYGPAVRVLVSFAG